MDMLQLKKAAAVLQPNHSILIYGPPKSGKTRLIATAAKLKEISKIYWFDIENGVETLLHMDLTDEELQKIVIIKIADTRENPIAIETILKSFSAKTPIDICELHGKVDCAECKKDGSPFIKWNLAQCTHNDLVVIDSGSQLGDSAINGACAGKPATYKPLQDEWGMAGKWLADICSTIQQCRNTNFVVATHEISLEDDEGKDRIFPLMGTKNFSMRCAKFFGTVVYVHKKLGKHVAGSSSTYRPDVLTGSRVEAKLESSKEPSMFDILIAGGILRAPQGAEIHSPQPAVTEAKPLSTIASRLQNRKL